MPSNHQQHHQSTIKIQQYITDIMMFFYQKKILDKSNSTNTVARIAAILKIDNWSISRPQKKRPITLKKHLQHIAALQELLEQKYSKKIVATNLVNEIMGLLTPTNNSQFIANSSLAKLYKLSLINNYVKINAVKQNIKYKFSSQFGKMIITINAMRPEVTTTQQPVAWKKSWPKCFICKENVGWNGGGSFASRQNLRTKNVMLKNQPWFMQFSPFPYFNRHLIVIAEQHRPMKIDQMTIDRLLDFVDIDSHYFIGTNSGMERTGGSILNHDHYQAGKTTLPLFKAKITQQFILRNDHIKVKILKWPVATICLSASNRDQIGKFFNFFFASWTKVKLPNIPNNHNNGCSIIVRKTQNMYHLYISLRNNVLDPKNPNGRFGTKKIRQGIKKEAVGLIETSGLAILPGRLQNEMRVLLDLLKTKNPTTQKEKAIWKKYASWSKQYLEHKQPTWNDVKKAIGTTFVDILNDNNPFHDQNGQFVKYVGGLVEKWEKGQ